METTRNYLELPREPDVPGELRMNAPVAARSVAVPTWTYCADEGCMECSVMRISGVAPAPIVPRLPLRSRLRLALGRATR